MLCLLSRTRILLFNPVPIAYDCEEQDGHSIPQVFAGVSDSLTNPAQEKTWTEDLEKKREKKIQMLNGPRR